jgi:hypothetical protein
VIAHCLIENFFCFILDNTLVIRDTPQPTATMAEPRHDPNITTVSVPPMVVCEHCRSLFASCTFSAARWEDLG